MWAQDQGEHYTRCCVCSASFEVSTQSIWATFEHWVSLFPSPWQVTPLLGPSSGCLSWEWLFPQESLGPFMKIGSPTSYLSALQMLRDIAVTCRPGEAPPPSLMPFIVLHRPLLPAAHTLCPPSASGHPPGLSVTYGFHSLVKPPTILGAQGIIVFLCQIRSLKIVRYYVLSLYFIRKITLLKVGPNFFFCRS